MPDSTRNVTAALLASLALAGCGGPRNFANDNDVLRGQVLDLERKVEALERSRDQLTAQLAESLAADGGPPLEVVANTPRVTSIGISRLSHVRRGAGGDTVAVLYIEPEDDRGRFVQMVGRLSVNAAILPAAGDAATVGLLELAPAALRDAYRSGLTGTHYTIEVLIQLPIDGSGAGTSSVLDVRVSFTDGHTGLEHTAHREIDLVSDRSARRRL